MNDSDHLPLAFTLLTGFLGSGKTTLLGRMLADPSMGDTAVLINEFGEIGLDHLLVSSLTEDVVLLESGCICCSVGDDFGLALESLLSRRRSGQVPPFRRVVLETSGIADPAPIQQRILTDERLSRQLSIHSVITVVDAVLGAGNLDRHLECVGQIVVADRIILSKAELARDAQRDELLCRLRKLNPTAPIMIPEPVGALPENLFGQRELLQSEFTQQRWTAMTAPISRPTPALRAESTHDHRYSTFVIRYEEPLDWQDFAAWIENLLLARGASILRMKGLIHVTGRANPVVVQGVQHCLYPPSELPAWPHPTPRTELVFITQDFPKEAALTSFRQFMNGSTASGFT